MTSFSEGPLFAPFVGIIILIIGLIATWWYSNGKSRSYNQSKDSPIDFHTLRSISKSIGKDIRMLGREIGLAETEMENIELDAHHKGTVEVAYQVLRLWAARKPNSTIEELLRSLRQIGRLDIVHNIDNLMIGQQFCRLQKRGTNKNDDIFLSCLQIQLRELYKGIVLQGFPWMEEVWIPIQNHYVELMMIQQDENGVDLPDMFIQLNEIFEVSNRTALNKSRILIEGGPGYGKTTVGYKLCYDYALTTDYMKHVDLVFILPLREFSGNLDEMLVKVSGVNESNAERLLYVLKDLRINVIFILEGYDELLPEHRQDINSLIVGDIFPHVTIIVSSRPGMFYIEIKNRRSNLLTSRDASIVTNPFALRIRIVGIPEVKLGEFAEKHLANFPSELKKIGI